jgi:4-amino-4-deoxy-L-arabinose transferase-like glycosyltransferase
LWSEEVRWAAIPREMDRAGDWFSPTFNGHVYYDKPLGSYWLVLVAARFTGGIDELAARLPSAVCGLLGVALVMSLASRLYGHRVAVLAGAVLSTSFGYVVFARTAAADMETVVGVLAALWLFKRNEERPGGWWTIGFWLAMAATSLTKGLLGFVLPLLVVGVYSTWNGVSRLRLCDGDCSHSRKRQTFGWLFNRTTLVAAPLAVAVYLAPFLLSPAGPAEGLSLVYRENVRRYVDPSANRGPVYLYAYVILMLLAPWSLLLPAALMRVRRRDRFAVTYFWVVFLFFTASASRRSYYLLPILPAAALLVAAVLARRGGRWRRLGGASLVAVVVAAPVVLVPPEWRPSPFNLYPPLPVPAALVAAWAVGVVALAVAAIRRRGVGLSLAAAVFALQAYIFAVALPASDADRTQRAFAAAARDRLGGDVGLALYRTREIVYYLDPAGPVPELYEPDELRTAVDRGDVRWLIVRRRDRAALGDVGTVVLAESFGRWDGADRAGTKLLLVRVGE